LEAANKLPGVIRKYHDQDNTQIDEPYKPLMELLSKIAARNDGARLMSTYLSASEIIAAHIQAGYDTNNPNRDVYMTWLEVLKRHVADK
jgi:hypothetical protein